MAARGRGCEDHSGFKFPQSAFEVSVNGSWRHAQFLGDEPCAEVRKAVFLQDGEPGFNNSFGVTSARWPGFLAGLRLFRPRHRVQ